MRAEYHATVIKTADFYNDNGCMMCELYKNQAFLTHSTIDFSLNQKTAAFTAVFWFSFYTRTI